MDCATAVSRLDPRRFRERDAVSGQPAAHLGIVLELWNARVVTRCCNAEHHILVSRLLHQVRHAATFAPVVDEGGHVAVREVGIAWEDATTPIATEDIDRKSTRLNSSHDQISYAV